MIISYIVALLFIVYGIIVLTKSGTRFMSKMLLTDHPEKYSLKRFKIVFSSAAFLEAAIFLIFSEGGDYLGLFGFIPIILMYLLFYTWCKIVK